MFINAYYGFISFYKYYDNHNANAICICNLLFCGWLEAVCAQDK